MRDGMVRIDAASVTLGIDEAEAHARAAEAARDYDESNPEDDLLHGLRDAARRQPAAWLEQFLAMTPKRVVEVDTYWIDHALVTQAEYAAFVLATNRPSSWKPTWDKLHAPMRGVSDDDARAFAVWMYKRLPTEAEREHAARLGVCADHEIERVTRGTIRCAWTPPPAPAPAKHAAPPAPRPPAVRDPRYLAEMLREIVSVTRDKNLSRLHEDYWAGHGMALTEYLGDDVDAHLRPMLAHEDAEVRAGAAFALELFSSPWGRRPR